MNNVVSFDMMELAAAARRASETLARIKEKEPKENMDLSPVQQCGHMMRRLLTNQAKLYRELCPSEHAALASAAAEVDSKLNTQDKIRNVIGEIAGTARNIAKIDDQRAIERAHTFLLKLAS